MMTPSNLHPPLRSRRHFGMALIGAGLVGVSGPDAFARNTPINAEASALFRVGRWAAAAERAAASKDPDNQAFAARSLLAGALLGPSGQARRATIARARTYAEAALVTDPQHVEARLQLATALGLQARAAAPARAYAQGMPQRVRRILDEVSRDAPNQAWAFALLGGWHFEGLRIGGSAATAMLGSSLTQGKAAFTRAMNLDPTEASTPFYFAASLLALDPPANADEARTLLARAQACPVRDAFQAAVKARATALRQSVEADGPVIAARLALGWLS